ncbi:MAG: ABC transporter permease, partial [Lachnospiraceae bacterium]|nr:ABC transporter permease [Lachnospiraceae bacterium]
GWARRCVYATVSGLNAEQVNKLKNHMDVEALEITEIFATVEYEKMNGSLNCGSQLKEGIYHRLGNLTEGHEAAAVDEICGPPAFFERMGVEPVIGNKIEISFRPRGEGMAETREFTICGLVTQVDLSKMDVSDSRIAYSATISEELAAEYLEPEEREYAANIRVFGEEELGYDEIQEKINQVAEDIGYDVEKVNFNRPYLYTMTNPGTEMMQIAGGIALLIVFFAGLVIYSIYYVSVITDIQEIGRLKALGASDRQVKRVLLTEGMRIAAFAVPVGLLLGYLIPYLAMPAVIRIVMGQSFREIGIGKLHMFSLPVLLLVLVAVLFVIYLSLRKPMRMAAKISPIEALRYQESSGKGKFRKGSKNVSLFRLSAANLLRNKKRTVVT